MRVSERYGIGEGMCAGASVVASRPRHAGKRRSVVHVYTWPEVLSAVVVVALETMLFHVSSGDGARRGEGGDSVGSRSQFLSEVSEVKGRILLDSSPTPESA